MTEPNSDDSAYHLKLYKNLIVITVISSFFTSYYSLSFCTSIKMILCKIGSHCPLFLLKKKKGN